MGLSSFAELALDFCVAFVFWGSSSDKYFTVLIIIGAVAGFLGSNRWYAVGDASYLEASLCQAGTFFLIIVALFEVDVSAKSFLEEKLLITTWFLEFLGTKKYLDFELSQYDPKLLQFLVRSDKLSWLYEEYDGNMIFEKSSFFSLNFSMHMLGASAYVSLTTASIVLNDLAEEKVAWIAGISFVLFATMGYLSGTYFPITLNKRLRGSILIWNPFVREPNFLIELQKEVNAYCIRKRISNGLLSLPVNEDKCSDCNEVLEDTLIPFSPTTLRRRSKRLSLSASKKEKASPQPSKTVKQLIEEKEEEVAELEYRRQGKKGTKQCSKSETDLIVKPTTKDAGEIASSEVHQLFVVDLISEIEMQQRAEKVLADHWYIRAAHDYPKQYLRILSHIFMLIELISFVTPLIAIGIQWITALCGSTPPTIAIVNLFYAVVECVYNKDVNCQKLSESCVWASKL